MKLLIIGIIGLCIFFLISIIISIAVCKNNSYYEEQIATLMREQSVNDMSEILLKTKSYDELTHDEKYIINLSETIKYLHYIKESVVPNNTTMGSLHQTLQSVMNDNNENKIVKHAVHQFINNLPTNKQQYIDNEFSANINNAITVMKNGDDKNGQK